MSLTMKTFTRIAYALVETGSQERASSSPVPPAGSARRARAPSPPRARACSSTTTAARSGRATVAAELGGAPIAQADLTDEARGRPPLRGGARGARTRSTSAPRSPVSGPPEDLPVWELPLERWEDDAAQNLTATFLTARASCARSPGRARLARARRLDGGHRRRSGARRLRGGEVGAPGRAAAWPEERGRAGRAARPGQRRRSRAGPSRR